MSRRPRARRRRRRAITPGGRGWTWNLPPRPCNHSGAGKYQSTASRWAASRRTAAGSGASTRRATWPSGAHDWDANTKDEKKAVCGGSFADKDKATFTTGRYAASEPPVQHRHWIGFRGVVRVPVKAGDAPP